MDEYCFRHHPFKFSLFPLEYFPWICFICLYYSNVYICIHSLSYSNLSAISQITIKQRTTKNKRIEKLVKLSIQLFSLVFYLYLFGLLFINIHSHNTTKGMIYIILSFTTSQMCTAVQLKGILLNCNAKKNLSFQQILCKGNICC